MKLPSSTTVSSTRSWSTLGVPGACISNLLKRTFGSKRICSGWEKLQLSGTSCLAGSSIVLARPKGGKRYRPEQARGRAGCIRVHSPAHRVTLEAIVISCAPFRRGCAHLTGGSAMRLRGHRFCAPCMPALRCSRGGHGVVRRGKIAPGRQRSCEEVYIDLSAMRAKRYPAVSDGQSHASTAMTRGTWLTLPLFFTQPTFLPGRVSKGHQ